MMLGRGLWTPDEPREADIAWRMSIQSGHAVPALAGQPFLEKPPLTYWAASASSVLFPEHESAFRVPNLLYAIVSTVAIVLLAFEMGGAGAAWVAGLVSATCLLVVQVTAWLASDAPMMAGVTLAMLGFYAGFNAADGRAKFRWYLLMHAGLTCAFLAKGPGAWLVPGLGAVGLIALERRWRELLCWELWAGVAIPVCIIGGWIAAVIRSNGPHALLVLLWSNVAGRAVALHGADALEYANGHRNWPAKYLVEFPLYVLPWTLLFVAAWRRSVGLGNEPNRRAWRFALAALLLPLLALSFAATARGIYAAPTLPAAALLIGLWAADAVSQPDAADRWLMRATAWLVAVVMIALFAAAVFVMNADPTARHLLFLFALCAITAMCAMWTSLRELRRKAWLRGLAATFVAFELTLLAAAAALFPALDQWQDLPALVRQIDTDIGNRRLALYAPDETIVATVDRVLGGGRHILRVDDVEAALRLLDTADPPVLLVRLHGMGDGRVLERLRAAGIEVAPAADSPELRELISALPLAIEQVYELPQGRRYALLSLR